jgi:putative hydrolase of the HAD superfamily
MIKAIFFDLFFTLIDPKYSTGYNEYDIVGISAEEWEHYTENDELYKERALGNIKDERVIIDRIIESIPYNISVEQKIEILNSREKRMQKALLVIDSKILHTIKAIHEKGVKICLISNADVIDSKYWNQSPIAPYFSEVVFSCDVGMMKPDLRMYEYALDKLNVKAEESLFVGDGGFDELAGARRAGMKVVFTEYLEKKEEKKREKLLQDADYHINEFDELINFIN